MKKIVIISILIALFSACNAPKANIAELIQITEKFLKRLKPQIFRSSISYFRAGYKCWRVILADSVYNYTQPAGESAIFQAASSVSLYLHTLL